METANRFARDLMVQEVGFAMLRDLGITLIAADSPSSFLDDGPTSKLIRQILGAVSEFDKAMTVAKLKGARDRVRRQRGKCEGRKSYAERREGKSWSRLRGNCITIPTAAHTRSALCSRFAAGGTLHQAGGTIPPLPSLRCSRSNCGARRAAEVLPLLSDLKPSCRHLKKDRSLAFRPGRFRPAEMLVRVVIEISQPMTRFVLPETSHLGRRNLYAVPLLFLSYNDDRRATKPLIKVVLCPVWLKGPFWLHRRA